MLIISVHLAHVFDRWTLTAPKVSRPLQLVLSGGPVTPTPIGEYNGLRGENMGPFKGQQASASNPVMWLWLAGLYVREALPHMLPATRYPATSWPTKPRGYSTAPQPVHTSRRPGSDCGLACWWTMNPGSGQSYCSFNSHTNSNSALVKYNLRASRWTHSTKLRDEAIPKHQNLPSSHIGAIGRHHEQLCMYFCKWNLCRDFMCECIKMLVRPVDCAIICSKRRSLCSITVS